MARLIVSIGSISAQRDRDKRAGTGAQAGLEGITGKKAVDSDAMNVKN